MNNREFFCPLTEKELQSYSGGGLLRRIGWSAVVGYIIDNWSDIKTAARDFVKEH
jgi:hypothetical protein